jgi:hypothetical protein
VSIPCLSCGACCVTYRITLPRSELDSVPGGTVPAALTEPYTATTACMREQLDSPGRCIALDGNVGQAVSCSIYAHRPEACRPALSPSATATNHQARRQWFAPLSV